MKAQTSYLDLEERNGLVYEIGTANLFTGLVNVPLMHFFPDFYEPEEAPSKAKGKEFENVFLLLENFNAAPEEAKRQLYVAMTRAKQNLTVHLNSNFLDNISAENLERIEDSVTYLPPEELVMNLNHKDVNLGYFEYVQHRLKNILPGDSLFVVGDGCTNSNGDLVLKFAKKLIENIEIRKQNGYELKSVKVNFIVYWRKDGAEDEVKIVLPELYFEKQHNEK